MAATYARPREVSDDEPPPLSAPTQELEEDSLHDDFRIGSLSAKDRERLKTRKQIRVLTQAIDGARFFSLSSSRPLFVDVCLAPASPPSSFSYLFLAFFSLLHIIEDRASGVLTTESLKDAVEKANVIYTESGTRLLLSLFFVPLHLHPP